MKKKLVLALCLLSSIASLSLSGCTIGSIGDPSDSSEAQPIDSNGEITGSSRGGTLSPAEIYSEANRSVVFVSIKTSYGSYSSGTGFFLDEEGTFVTNYHVIDQGVEGSISDYQGNVYEIGCVKGYDIERDIAICSSSALNTCAASFGDSSEVNAGDTVYSIYYSDTSLLGDASSSFSSGMVSSRLTLGGVPFMETNMGLECGGPLLNERGEVIGVSIGWFTYDEADYCEIAFPSNSLSLVSSSLSDPLDLVTRKVHGVLVKLYVDGELFVTVEVSYGHENDEATLDFGSKPGYTFDGWYIDPDCSIPYESGPVTDSFSLYGRLVPKTYEIYLDPNGGNLEEEVLHVTYDSPYELPTPTRKGYTFLGWFDPREGLRYYSGVYSIEEDLSLTAAWEAKRYSIAYNLDGGVNSASNPDSYTVEDSFALEEPSKDGYSFQGWYLEPTYETKVDSIKEGSIGNLELYAKWSANEYRLDVASSDDSKGSVEVSGEGLTGETICIRATPTEGCYFAGWYKGEELISQESVYTFTMPSEDVSMTALFKSYSEEKAKALGMVPVVSTDGKTLTYGLYPQTHVSDASTIASLDALSAQESNGWYLLDGEYYAKTEANPWGDDYMFDDGASITKGATYWFKCEPISWKILTSSEGEHSLLSTYLLDRREFNDIKDETGSYKSFYEQSSIRKWLNGDFYNTAFSLDDSYVETTLVDNSENTIEDPDDGRPCADTEDKVYLLSCQDYKNRDYFASDSARECKTTDYARAVGSASSWYTSLSLYNYGFYWSRSPSMSNGVSPFSINNGGGDSFADANFAGASVRPAITIKIAD